MASDGLVFDALVAVKKCCEDPVQVCVCAYDEPTRRVLIEIAAGKHRETLAAFGMDFFTAESAADILNAAFPRDPAWRRNDAAAGRDAPKAGGPDRQTGTAGAVFRETASAIRRNNVAATAPGPLVKPRAAMGRTPPPPTTQTAARDLPASRPSRASPSAFRTRLAPPGSTPSPTMTAGVAAPGPEEEFTDDEIEMALVEMSETTEGMVSILSTPTRKVLQAICAQTSETYKELAKRLFVDPDVRERMRLRACQLTDPFAFAKTHGAATALATRPSRGGPSPTLSPPLPPGGRNILAPRGLENTCFMESVLNVFLHAPPLLALLRGTPRKVWCKEAAGRPTSAVLREMARFCEAPVARTQDAQSRLDELFLVFAGTFGEAGCHPGLAKFRRPCLTAACEDGEYSQEAAADFYDGFVLLLSMENDQTSPDALPRREKGRLPGTIPHPEREGNPVYDAFTVQQWKRSFSPEYFFISGAGLGPDPKHLVESVAARRGWICDHYAWWGTASYANWVKITLEEVAAMPGATFAGVVKQITCPPLGSDNLECPQCELKDLRLIHERVSHTPALLTFRIDSGTVKRGHTKVMLSEEFFRTIPQTFHSADMGLDLPGSRYRLHGIIYHKGRGTHSGHFYTHLFTPEGVVWDCQFGRTEPISDTRSYRVVFDRAGFEQPNMLVYLKEDLEGK